MSNIAEGFERGGDKECRQFLAFAKGSTGEVKSQLYAALDAALITENQFRELYDLADRAARTIAAFMRYLGSSGYRGAKYR